MTFFFFATFLVLKFNLFITVETLDLETLHSLGISDQFFVNDIVVHLNRAYLAIPRNVCKNNFSHPTLVEVPWKDQFNIILKSRFSNKLVDGQVWANCSDVQNAVSLAKESIKSKLWILDKGNEYCPPKLLAYNMLQNAFLNDEFIELNDIPNQGLNTIIIESDIKLGEHRAYIASGGENILLVCYLNVLECVKITLLSENNPIHANFLSMSKVDTLLYLTGTSENIFALDTSFIPSGFSENENNTDLAVSVKTCGQKLGPSSGLETDVKNGLMYYLTRDFAIVRWITDKPMKAEYHEVLVQSYEKMPYVSRIFTDSQGGIFALTNPFSPATCQKDDLINEPFERALKIAKYNWLLDKFI